MCKWKPAWKAMNRGWEEHELYSQAWWWRQTRELAEHLELWVSGLGTIGIESRKLCPGHISREESRRMRGKKCWSWWRRVRTGRRHSQEVWRRWWCARSLCEWCAGDMIQCPATPFPYYWKIPESSSSFSSSLASFTKQTTREVSLSLMKEPRPDPMTRFSRPFLTSCVVYHLDDSSSLFLQDV